MGERVITGEGGRQLGMVVGAQRWQQGRGHQSGETHSTETGRKSREGGQEMFLLLTNKWLFCSSLVMHYILKGKGCFDCQYVSLFMGSSVH